MHKAKNCLVTCIDYRIQKALFEWLEKKHKLGNTDIIEIAGSSRDLVKPINQADESELLKNIQLSVSLHNPDNIIVLDHQDCGGYAQDNTISAGLPLDTDLAKHTKYLKKTKKILLDLFPDKNIKTMYVSLAGKVIDVE